MSYSLPLILAFSVVVLVWSTTPLAIQLSNDSVSFITAVSARMLIGAGLATLLNKCLGLPLPWKAVWRSYCAGAIGFFGAMCCVYWAAQFIPSGLIAVVYGTAPLISGVMAWWLLGERSLTPLRVVMLILAIAGLGLIFQGELSNLDDLPRLLKGIGGVLCSTILFCLSAVLIKREQQLGRTPGHPITQTAGALIVTAIGYVLLWSAAVLINTEANLPLHISIQSSLAILYLAVFGSVIGFLCYFTILQKMTAEKVALITLITPVLALALGYFVANESLSWSTAIGTATILLALLVYQRSQPPSQASSESPCESTSEPTSELNGEPTNTPTSRAHEETPVMQAPLQAPLIATVAPTLAQQNAELEPINPKTSRTI